MNANELKTYWITKYALTQGIFTIQGQIIEDTPTMIKDTNAKLNPYYFKPFWHDTPEDAIKHAELMRLKKFESINKTIAKLKKINFERQAIHVNVGEILDKAIDELKS